MRHIVLIATLGLSLASGGIVGNKKNEPFKTQTPYQNTYSTTQAPYQTYKTQTPYQKTYSTTQAPYQTYATPAPESEPIDEAKTEFQRFWDNSKLCSAEFGLRKCLVTCSSRSIFFLESRIEECAISFVQGVCGSLDTYQTRGCDNGRVSITKENCVTSAYADAIQIFNTVINHLDENLITNLHPNSWPFVTTKLAVAITREQSDCVTDAFFYYLNQCSMKHFIDEDDRKCVLDVLTDPSCQEEASELTWSKKIRYHGIHGANEVVNYVNDAYDGNNKRNLFSEIIENMKDESKVGIHSLNFDWDSKSMQGSLNVCPLFYLPMNAFYSKFGIQGIPESLTYFHFPLESKFSGSKGIVNADPITKDLDSQSTCNKFYQGTKQIYKATNGKWKIPNFCVSIDGYSIRFVETGNVLSLNYKAIKQSLGPYQCYDASWKAQRGCTAHLSEWRMQVTCCKSYASVLKEQGNSGIDRNDKYMTKRNYQVKPKSEFNPEPAVSSLIYTKIIESNDKLGRIVPSSSNLFPLYKELVEDLTKDYTEDKIKSFCRGGDKSQINSNNEYSTPFISYFSSEESEMLYTPSVPTTQRQSASSPTTSQPRLSASNLSTPAIFLLATDQPTQRDYYNGSKAPECYMVNSNSYKSTCSKLQIKLNFDTIVPLTNDACYPQSCTLSQLATCVNKKKVVETSHYGYQNKGGYQQQNNGYQKKDGYQQQNNGYQKKDGYQQQNNGYQNKDGYQPQNNGYQNKDGYQQQNNGYQNKDGYQPQTNGYQKKDGYQQQNNGYQKKDGYQQQNNGYQKKDGYQPQTSGYQKKDGYQQQNNGYQKKDEYQPQTNGYQNKDGYQQQNNGYQNKDGYQPQTNGYQNKDGYQPQTNGYQNKDGYQQQNNGYQNKDGYQQQNNGYQKKDGYQQQNNGYQNKDGYQPQTSGYQKKDGYQPQTNGYQKKDGSQQQNNGYQKKDGYQQQNNGYQNKDGHQQQNNGYQNKGGYQPQTNGYQKKGGYQQQQSNNNNNQPASSNPSSYKTSQSSGRLLLDTSSSSFSVAQLAAAGFVAGSVIIAVIQLFLRRRDETPTAQYQLL